MRRLTVTVLAAALCVAADVHAAPVTAPAASEVPASPGEKELADAHAFLRNVLNLQEHIWKWAKGYLDPKANTKN